MYAQFSGETKISSFFQILDQGTIVVEGRCDSIDGAWEVRSCRREYQR